MKKRSNQSSSGKIAQSFVKRAQTLGLKGKARDRAAIEFTVGAAAAIEAAGVRDGGVMMLAFLTTVRGYSVIEDAARDATT